jgi:hypothetical protein
VWLRAVAAVVSEDAATILPQRLDRKRIKINQKLALLPVYASAMR